MSIKDEIIELNQTKQGIKTVFEEKGVDLEGKTFADTPALIEGLNVGRGDEVQAFALGAAKDAKENDKVILNFSADMLPGEANALNIPSSADYMRSGYIYIDRNNLYFGWDNKYSGYYPMNFARNTDGDYNYIGRLTNPGNSGTIVKVSLPYGIVSYIGGGEFYVIAGANTTRYDTYGGYSNAMAGAQSKDYKIATFGTRESTYIFKLSNNTYSLLSKTAIDATRTSAGVLMDGDNYRIVVIYDKTVSTYSLDIKTGETSLLGSTNHTMGVGSEVNMWRPIGMNRVICRTGTTNGTVTGLFAFSYKFENGLCTVSKDSVLTSILQSTIANTGLSTLNNIVVVDDTDIYGWGDVGVFCIRYDETSQTATTLPSPFIDIPYSPQFFIHPVDKVAVMSTSAKDIYIRNLDAPITQKYIATKAGEGLQFQSVSLTGFVKENKDGVLTVQTLTDPNVTPPAYPDTYGMNVTVNGGSPATSNYSLVGSPSLNGSVLSGITSNNYLSFSNLSTTPKSVEVNCCFAPTANQNYAIWVEGQYNCSIDYQGYLEFIYYISSGTYTSHKLTSFKPTLGQKIWTKWVYENGGSSFYYSLDGKNYIQVGYKKTHALYINTSETQGRIGWGGTYTGQEYYLDQYSIVVDGNTFFRPFIDEGSADISWGWFKNGEDYVKWQGGKATLSENAEGEKAPTMGLWLVKDGEVTKPVLTAAEPTNYAVKHYLQDVYLSDTLDYILPMPYGLETSILHGHQAGEFVQPVLTANGVIGIDSFAVSATNSYSSYYPYICFSTSSNEAWISSSSASTSNPIDYTLYSDVPIQISSIDMKNRSNTDEMLGNFVFQASDDGQTWMDIASFENRINAGGELVTFEINEEQAYRYHRFHITSNVSGNSGRVSIGKLTVTAAMAFLAGSATVSDGWQEFDGVRYFMREKTTKDFSDVVLEPKATTMNLWLTKTEGQTDFAVSVDAPIGVDACYKTDTVVYLSNDLTYFVPELQPVDPTDPTDPVDPVDPSKPNLPKPEFGGTSVTITGKTNEFTLPTLPDGRVWDIRTYAPVAGYCLTDYKLQDGEIYLLTLKSWSPEIKRINVASIPSQYNIGNIEYLEWEQYATHYYPYNPNTKLLPVITTDNKEPEVCACNLIKRILTWDSNMPIETFSDNGVTNVNGEVSLNLQRVEVQTLTDDNVVDSFGVTGTTSLADGGTRLIQNSNTHSHIVFKNDNEFDSICFVPTKSSTDVPIEIYSISELGEETKIYETKVTTGTMTFNMNFAIGRGHHKVKIVFPPNIEFGLSNIVFLKYL